MTVETPKLRFSSLRDCPRKAVLEATTPPDREPTRKERGWMFRGKSLGRDYALMLAAAAIDDGRNGLIHVDSGDNRWVPETLLATNREAAAFVAEQRIPWALGVGHADVFATETGTIIEILSSASASGDRLHSKLLQGVGYAMHYEPATSACLVVIDPSDLTDERIIVTKGSRQWNDLAAEVAARVDQVLAWNNTREWPARVCAKPMDAYGHFCRHADTCFAGWEPEPLEHVESEEAQQLAIRLSHVKGRRKELASTDRTLETEQKEIQTLLADEVPAGTWQVGGYQVTRSVRGRQSFDLARAALDSRLPVDVIDEFTKRSEYEVWDVKKTAPVVATADETVPF